MFRSAIGGFNKEDVIEYIDGINRAAAENQDWFDRQSKAMAETIKRLTQENNSLKSAAANSAQEYLQLQEQLEQMQEGQGGEGQDEAARQQIEQLQRQLAEQAEALEESERRFNAVIERGDGDAVLAEKYHDLEADHKALQAEYEELKKQAAPVDQERQEQMANALLRMRNELRASNERESALEQQLEELRSRAAQAGEEGYVPAPVEDTSELEQRMAELQKENENLRADTDQKMQKAQAALIEARNRINGLETQLAQAQSVAVELEKKVEEAQQGGEDGQALEDLRAQTALQVDQAQAEATRAQAEQAKAEALLAKEQAQRELAEQKAENLFNQNKLLSNRVSAMQSEMEKANSQDANVQELEQELRTLRDKTTLLETEKKRLQTLNDQLSKNENVPGTEELRILYDKSRLYDDIKNNVSKLVSDARRKAAEIIYEAEQSSRQIMSDGVSSLAEMQRRIRSMQEEIQSIQKDFEGATGNVNTLFNNISDTLSITDNHLISMLGENGADVEEKSAEAEWPL